MTVVWVVGIVASFIAWLFSVSAWSERKMDELRHRASEAAVEQAHEIRLAEMQREMVDEVVAAADDWPVGVQIPALFVRDSRRRVFDQDIYEG